MTHESYSPRKTSKKNVVRISQKCAQQLTDAVKKQRDQLRTTPFIIGNKNGVGVYAQRMPEDGPYCTRFRGVKQNSVFKAYETLVRKKLDPANPLFLMHESYSYVNGTQYFQGPLLHHTDIPVINCYFRKTKEPNGRWAVKLNFRAFKYNMKKNTQIVLEKYRVQIV